MGELLLLRLFDPAETVRHRHARATIHIEAGVEDRLLVAVRVIRGKDPVAAVIATSLHSDQSVNKLDRTVFNDL